MIPLATALQDRGHDVLWATGPDACPRLEAAGIRAEAVGDTFEALRVQLFQRYPEVRALAPAALAEFVFPRLFGEIAARSMFEGVMATARAWRPHVVVHDAAEFTGAIAAESVDAPSVTHSFGALTPRSRVSEAAQRVELLWRAAGLQPRAFGGAYDYLYLDIYPPGLQSESMSHVPRVQLLRPVPFDDTGADGTFEAFGEPDRPLVYVTLGTVDRDTVPLRRAVEAIGSLDVRVLATVGPNRDPEILGSQPSNVRVERYVPQTQVLGQCSIVATHAGSGTFLAALGRGIPQLCMPQAADQFINANACVRAGAGLALSPAEATADAIRDAVGRLLKEPSFRARSASTALG